VFILGARSVGSPPDAGQSGFADALRERTRDLHAHAERSGIVRAIMAGRVSRLAYALYLRCLLPAYQQLETGLERHRHVGALQGIARREVYRSAALQADLDALCSTAMVTHLPLPGAAARYVAHLASVADECAEALVAHAYTRFLGDLNGGRILSRALARNSSDQPLPLNFHRFPAISDIAQFAAQYRRSFDAAGTQLAEPETVLREAELAFQFNIDVSIEVEQATMPPESDRI
jgi:heme oxygenase (biliverdin-producing, ferredoxin)